MRKRRGGGEDCGKEGSDRAPACARPLRGRGVGEKCRQFIEGLGQGTCVRASSVMQWRARWNTSWDMLFFSYAAVSISIVQSRRAVTAGCNVLMAATASLHCFRHAVVVERKESGDRERG